MACIDKLVPEWWGLGVTLEAQARRPGWGRRVRGARRLCRRLFSAAAVRAALTASLLKAAAVTGLTELAKRAPAAAAAGYPC